MATKNAKSASQPLTARQIRAARALLAWSQRELAQAASIAQSTVADFERGQRTPVPNNIEAMRDALTGAGVNFLPGGAIIGPHLPTLAVSRSGGAPVRWVNAVDLEQWSDRRDAQGALPTLLSNLIRASSDPAVQLRFPADEGVSHRGWDGLTKADIEFGYVPAGEAGWEIGTQRRAIARKAQEDFAKRTIAPAPLDPATSTFVFVTTRHWPGKEEWARARQDEGQWRDVRAYDVNDLVHWIEQCPAVGHWLAAKMGKRPQGLHQLEDIWREWSLATEWPLTEELILSDRDEDAAVILKWLRDKPSTLSLKGESADEISSFVYAAIKSLPENAAENYLTHSVIAATADTARAVADSGTPLIIILLDPEPGLARTIVQKGHHVLLAYGDGAYQDTDVRRIARPSRDGIETALTNAGIARARAETLARDSSRSLAVLRRLIPHAPGRLPSWAEGTPLRTLTAALLAGAWDSKSEADKAILERLAAPLSYDEIETSLADLTNKLDSPIRRSGTIWRVASPRDAWFLLGRYLTKADFDNYQSAVIDVLTAANPLYEINSSNRWKAAFDNVKPQYSDWLRIGLGEVLILLALFSDRTLDARENSMRVSNIVKTLLNDADKERWWSLSHDFRLLAEAAPQTFVDAINRSLDRPDKPIQALFENDESPLGAREYLSDLLWALESLAWSRTYLSTVVDVLARLDAIDPGGQHSNRPANSLRNIFLLWSPQTNVNLDERLRMLRRLMRERKDTAWKLLISILPQSHDIAIPGAKSRWRDFSDEKPEVITYELMHRGAVEISNYLIELADHDLNKWSDLVDRLQDLAPDSSKAIDALENAAAAKNDPESRERLRDALRKTLHHHRQFPDADWSMEEKTLNVLQSIYDGLSTDDTLGKFSWLFRPNVRLPNPTQFGWREEEEEITLERQRAVKSILDTGGIDTLFDLAHAIETPGHIGGALVQPEVDEATRDAVLQRSLKSTQQSERDIGYGMIYVLFQERRESWAQELLERAKSWGSEATQTILAALPSTRWTWERAREAGVRIEDHYWKHMRHHWVDGDAADYEFAAKKLIAAGRAHHAVDLLGHARGKEISSDIIVGTLKQAVAASAKPETTNDAAMFRHYTAELIKQLDQRDDVDSDTLLQLEWLYLPLLEHSERPPKTLVRALSERPEFFVEVLRTVFQPSENNDEIEPAPENHEHAEHIARRAYDLLRLWDRIPGSDDAGQVDSEQLGKWIQKARLLTAQNHRSAIGDIKIGEMLSASQCDADGSWPLIAIRDIIEQLRSDDLERGLEVGAYNRRGVTTRGMRDGGELERNEAERYRDYARKAAIEWPRTAAVLERIASYYESEAKAQDERAEQVDWR